MLPPELIPLLAADPDPSVRHLLAEYQENAPPKPSWRRSSPGPTCARPSPDDPSPRTGLAHLLAHH
ncbi:hypothetical protein, partial [Kitasatospora albolonga]|uniref:hypothetical protein n=1 Tax=Kitasatospora albolonga TaxID=68173 RepID=UPI0031EF4053